MILLTLSAGNWIAISTIIVGVVSSVLALIGKILYRQGGLDKSVNNLERRVENIDKKVDKIDEKFDKYLLQPVSNSQSPLKLNDLGNKIFEREEIQNFVKKYLPEIVKKIKSYKFHSAYEAQEILFSIVSSYKEGESKTSLENAAYDSAQHIDILMKVIALGIRDEIFKDLEYDVDDIDKSDPKKK